MLLSSKHVDFNISTYIIRIKNLKLKFHKYKLKIHRITCSISDLNIYRQQTIANFT